MRNDSIADREPCPWRIVDDIGGAFCMGSIGGGIFHIIKGSWTAPSGTRVTGALNALSARGPVLGGQFAVWGGLFACCDCSLTALRQKEDPWNSIISGAATGGILAARAGPKAVAQAAVVGGTLLALIEGMGIMFTRMMSPSSLPTPEEMAAMGSVDPTAPPTSGGLMLPRASAPSSSSTINPFALLGGTSSSSSSTGGDFDTFGSETTFSTESSSQNTTDRHTSGGSSSRWWPFGASS